MTENEERQAVVAEAQSWIGTPYHSNADIKGVGVDCGMILLRVFGDLGFIGNWVDPRPYPPQWPLHQSGEAYLSIVLKYAHEVEAGLPGDVVLFKVGRVWAHGGIIAPEWPWIVHATPSATNSPVRCENVKQDLKMSRMVPRFFSIWPREG